MKQYGLIGRRLDHSLSKRLFEERFEGECYELHEIESLDGLREWAMEMGGFNVTLPYKEAVVPLMDALTEEAEKIGAVNVVEVREGRLVGHNTDAFAFAESVQPLLRPWHKEALILGTGGAAKAVAYGLKELGIESRMVSRSGATYLSYSEAASLAKDIYLIVNATPVGMVPLEAQTPWRETRMLSPRHLCYDLIYNPDETRFLLEAELSGATTCNGLKMLQLQAEKSWRIWGLE